MEGLIRGAYFRNFTVSPQFLEALSSGHGTDQSGCLFSNSWQLNIRSKYFPTAIACLLSPTPCLKLFVQPGVCLYL